LVCKFSSGWSKAKGILTLLLLFNFEYGVFSGLVRHIV